VAAKGSMRRRQDGGDQNKGESTKIYEKEVLR